MSNQYTSLAGYAKALLTGHDSINDAGEIRIDFLGMTPTRFSVRGEPSGAVAKRYLNGDTLRRYAFALEGRCDTISDTDRENNNALFEGLAVWLDCQTKGRKLPAMNEGARPLGIEAAGSVYLMEQSEDGDTAVYMVQIVLTYYQKLQKTESE